MYWFTFLRVTLVSACFECLPFTFYFLLYIYLYNTVLYSRNRIESRRRRIAMFHLRQRTLLHGWSTYNWHLQDMRKQYKTRFRGEFHFYCKSAYLGVTALQRWCLAEKRHKVTAYRGVLFWKFWRCSIAMKQFRSFTLMRRAKRSALRAAQCNYEMKQRKAACVEFLHIAFPVSTDYNANGQSIHSGHVGNVKQDRERELAMRVVGRWRAFMRRNRNRQCRVIVNNIGSTSSKKHQQQECKNQAEHQLLVSLGPVISLLNASRKASATTPVPVSQLSRAKPRSDVPCFVPLPLPPRSTHVNGKSPHAQAQMQAYFEVSSTSVSSAINKSMSESASASASRQPTPSSHQAHLEANPYAYLSFGTTLPRPAENTKSRQISFSNPTSQSTQSTAAAATAAAVRTSVAAPTQHTDINNQVVGSLAAPRKGTDNVYRIINGHIQINPNNIQSAKYEVPIPILHPAAGYISANLAHNYHTAINGLTTATEASTSGAIVTGGGGSEDKISTALLKDILLFLDEFKHIL